MGSEANYDEIRRRIKRKYDNRVEFFSHIVAFLGVNLVLWGVLQPQNGWYTLSMIGMGGWFVGVLCHVVVFWGKEMQEREIERAIEREYDLRGHQPPEADVKRKRDRLRLTADGELLDVVDEDEERVSRKR